MNVKILTFLEAIASLVVTFSLTHSVSQKFTSNPFQSNPFHSNPILSDPILSDPILSNPMELNNFWQRSFFDLMHSLDCDEMNKVEQSWTKLNKVEQSWTKLNKVEQSLKHCYRVISENLVKFDKQIAENIKLLLSVCEWVSLWVKFALIELLNAVKKKMTSSIKWRQHKPKN